MPAEQGKSKMPSVTTLVVAFASFFIIYSVIVGISGCLNDVGLRGLVQGVAGAAVDRGNTCSLAFMTYGINIAGWFLGLAGTIFDWTLLALVVAMGSLVGNGGPFAASINLGWTVIRDFVNIAFIAGLIYAAISLILNLSGQGSKPGALIVKILIAALLVNFSYFFGAVIIDASNFVSQKIYREAISDTAPFQNPFSFDGGSPRLGLSAFEAPVSSRFMAVTRLGSLYNIQGADFTDPDGIFSDNSIFPYVLAFMGVVLFALTASVFFTAALFLVIRFVVIVILLITAPIGILYFMNFSIFTAWGKAWWDTLIAQSLFPVVFLTLIAVSFKVMEVGFVNTIQGDKSLFDLISNPSDLDVWYTNLNLVFVFFIAWFLIYFSIQAASRVAQQQKFVPPSPAKLFAGAQEFGKKASLLYPRSLAFKAVGAAIGPGKVRETILKDTGLKMLAEDIGRGLGSVGAKTGLGKVVDRGGDIFRTKEEKFARKVSKTTDQRLEDISNMDLEKVTPEERKAAHDDWKNAPEEKRRKAIAKAKGKQLDTLAKIDAGSGAQTKLADAQIEKAGETKPDTKKDDKSGGKDSSQTNASLVAAEKRVADAVASLERALTTGNDAILRTMQNLTDMEFREVLLANRGLLADRNNTRRIIAAVGKEKFDKAIDDITGPGGMIR